jgi:hypothetical protein
MKKLLLFLFLIVSITVAARCQEILQSYEGFWENKKEVTVLDLIAFFPDELPYLRNEIYARYGRAFATSLYQEYFRGKSWYEIKQNYNDAWLSESDIKNAEFIRSIEQSPLNFKDTLSVLLKNIEYKNDDAVLTFTSKNNVIWTDPNIDFGAYGLNGYNAQDMQWLIMGDWILVHRGRPNYFDVFDVVAYKLDHASRRILDVVSGEIEIAVLERLIELQENR